MVGERFLSEVSRVLKVRGRVRLVTDDSGYAVAMECAASGINALRQLEDDLQDYPPTEFQIKFLDGARPVYGFAFQRVS